ncbi:MAG TPA: hypothetical protein VLD37_02915 [Candidatus Bilamarchaeum sp.]|nr:hypothetical protein [Candidatus Bilamarchaeum sp.]
MAHRIPDPKQDTPEQGMASMRGHQFHYDLNFQGRHYIITTEQALPFGRERDALLDMARNGRFFDRQDTRPERVFIPNSPSPNVTVRLADDQPGAKEWNAQPAMARTDLLQSDLARAIERGAIGPMTVSPNTPAPATGHANEKP